MRWLAALLVCGGCGRIGFDAFSSSDGTLGDAPPCTYGPFSAPVLLPGPIQSSTDDWVPHTTLGTTQMFFCTYNAPAVGSCDLFYATRADASAAFGPPIHIAELGTANYDGGPTVTEDGLDMVFFSNPGGFDLFETTRVSVGDAWGPPTSLAFNTPATEEDAAMTADGLRIVFGSGRTGSIGGDDIWESTRASRATAWTAPVRIAEIATTSSENNPVLTADGLEILFDSNRAGGPGMFDIYTARRPAVDQPFGPTTLVPQLSSSLDDVSGSISADGLSYYINYNTLTAGGANADIWVATRTCN